MTLSIVQSAFTRNASTPTVVTLPSSPTLGNHLLVIYLGRNSNPTLTPFLPLAEQDQGNFNSFQGTQCWFGPVSTGIGQTFTLTGISDMCNVAVFEISGASANLSVFAALCFGTSATITTPPLPGNVDPAGLNLFALGWDNGVGITSTPTSWSLLSPALWQNTGNYHDGAIYSIPNTAASTQSITFNAPMDTNGAVFVNIQIWNTTAVPPWGTSVWDAASRGNIAIGQGNLLIGGGLLALVTGASASIRANRKIHSLTYWEITLDQLVAPVAIGLCNESFNITGTALPGSDNNALGYESTGAVVLNNVTLATLAPYAQGNLLQIAVDLANHLVWFNVNGGSWNNVSTNSPATGVGGISFASINPFNNLYPVFGGTSGNPGTTITANFTGPFAYAVPTGFSSLDLALVSASVNLGQGITDAVNTGFNGPNQYSLFGNGRLGGSGSVSGMVQENSTAAARRVRLYDEASGQLLGEAMSDPATGNYAISALGRNEVYAVALNAPNFNAQVLDRLTPQ